MAMMLGADRKDLLAPRGSTRNESNKVTYYTA